MTVNPLDLVDICRTPHLTTTEDTFFTSAHRTFTKIDHILGDKTTLNKCLKDPSHIKYLSNHNGVKLDINNRSMKNLQIYRS